MDARLIVEGAGAGDWNMAVDQVLLGHAEEAGQPVLRFYQWAEPTLSLGYFQKIDDRHAHVTSRTCSLVRRSSGGGAILHDRELTYSLVLPDADRRFGTVHDRYRSIHGCFIDALHRCGVATRLYRDCGRSHGAPADAFLCFQRRTEWDLILAGYKVLGSAQRRLRSAVLQHGSLLLGASRSAPELPGIEQLTGHRLQVGPIIETVLDRLRGGLQLEFRAGPLTSEERAAAQEVVVKRYGSDSWTARR